MKKMLCLLISLLLCCCAAAETASPAPSDESLTLGFEDGFLLELPAGWKYYSPDDAMTAQGVLYCLSDADGARWLHIQSWDSDCADAEALKGLIDRTTRPQTSGIYTFNDTDFVIYDLEPGDVSCCAVLLNGRVLNFVFTPQSDAEYMGLATRIISSFRVLASE